MKKILFSFIATAVFSTAGFANTPILENEIELTKPAEKTEITVDPTEEEAPTCTVTCSTTIHGVTYTTEAGNWFSSCEGAASRCDKKLAQLSNW